MGNSKFLLAFLCFFFYVSFTSTASSTKNHSCRTQQSLALLQFKQNLFSINHTSYDYDSTAHTILCRARLGLDYHPQMLNWNKSIDCCKWDGVTCNHVTGDVIGLDLSCGMLQGSLHPNSTIFHLPHLQSLNLAYNDFGSSILPHEIGRFANSLTHLNISNALFSGQIPSDISLLSKLVSLDLSNNQFSFKLGPHIFNDLLQNSTYLRQLLLRNVNISSALPRYLNMSSLEILDLTSTGLHGKLPDNIFSLPFLERLDLSGNSGLTDALPKINRSTSLPLTWLNLQLAGVSGGIPRSIGHLSSLNHLDLSFTELSGKIPYSIGNMRSLNALYLLSCNFMGSIPNSLGNLKYLTYLDLSVNKLNGTLPSSLFTLPTLQTVSLRDNMFSGSIPSELFTLRHLEYLSLRGNQLVGHIDILDHSLVPSFNQLSNLTYLDLSYNNFTGTWELDTLLSSLRNLSSLLLSYSGLSVVSIKTDNGYVNPRFGTIALASCKVTEFPNSLRGMKSLRYLDLSDNQIKGSIPNWLGEIGGNSLLYLDLSHNSITGLPDHELQWNVLLFLILASNLIQGSFPPSICNSSNIRVLDMSNNFFSGVIPRCFGNLSHSLEVVNLGNNNFQGTIPDLYKNCALLFGIMLNGNQLQGEVSSSFSRCQSLQILDLGNNNLTGTFPTWLGDLPQLQVLDLRSNKFHGTIESSSTVELPFPSLRVLDLSQNAFEGNLPRFLGTLKAMQKKSTKLEYLQLVGLYYYSVTLMVKDALLSFPKISVAYTVVDLSNNMFEYVIPDSIGSLASLIVLNLSHNSLIGHIPDALGNLSEIESLDISWNQLTGEIPQSLADLKFLSVLNLSQNHLMGRIPRGSQFDTFQGSSFGGNSELCGSQVPRNCDGPTPPTLQHEEADDDEGIMSGFTWKVVMIGYGGGTLFGLLIGHLMFLTRKPKWFNAMVDEQELRIRRRHDVRYIHIGK